MPDPSTTHEQELERFRTIVEVAGDPIYTLNAEGRFTYVNDALVEATGYSRAELLGEDVSLVLGDAAIDRAEVAIEDLLETGDRSRTVTVTFQAADGSRRDAEITIALLPFGDEFRGTVGVGRTLE